MARKTSKNKTHTSGCFFTGRRNYLNLLITARHKGHKQWLEQFCFLSKSLVCNMFTAVCVASNKQRFGVTYYLYFKNVIITAVVADIYVATTNSIYIYIYIYRKMNIPTIN